MNTNEIYDEALTSAVAAFEPGYPRQKLELVMKKTRGKTFATQLQMVLGRDDSRLKDAIQHYEQYIHSKAVFGRISSLEGASDLLVELKNAGYRLAMATGMNPSLLSRLFSEGILPDVFEEVATIHDIEDPDLQKPHPKILLDVLARLQLSPAEAMYVGDTIDDIEMANKCGVFSVAVLTGRLKEEEALAHGAALILDSALALARWN